MATIKLQGNASGSGNVTLTAPNTNSTRTITLPDADMDFGSLNGASVPIYGTASAAAALQEDQGVSSLTDDGVGRYLYNFSSAMSSTQYFSCGVHTYGSTSPYQRYLSGNYTGGNLDYQRTTTQAAVGAFPEGYADRENGIIVVGTLG
jgi:hypothetical protein